MNFVALWDNEFFNRSVGPVYNINGPPDGLPQETIVVDPTSASLHRRGRHAAPVEVRSDDRSMTIAGGCVASDPGTGMTLYRVDGPGQAASAARRDLPRHMVGTERAVHALSLPRRDADRHAASATAPLQPRPITVVATRPTGALGRIVGPAGRDSAAQRAASRRQPALPGQLLDLADDGSGEGAGEQATPAMLGIRFRASVFRPGR